MLTISKEPQHSTNKPDLKMMESKTISTVSKKGSSTTMGQLQGEEEEEGKDVTGLTPPEGVIQLNDGKAGMEGLDLDKINKIINDTSRGSKFYEHKKKRGEQLRKRVSDMRAQVAALSPEVIAKAEKQVDLLAKQLEEKRDLSRTIVHLDMDAFYASVEMRDNPKLKEVPMAVGGLSMLSTSNYVARKYGVRSGMPGFIARKLCPQLVLVPLNFEKYTAASKEVEQVLMEYDKESLYVSMDEAVLDITTYLAERNSLASDLTQTTPEELVHEIRGKILEKTGLAASGGIAANGLLAKICSDINKPNNQYFLENSKEGIANFLKELPIRKVGGIGPVTEEMLKGGLDIENCGDLWEKRGLIQLLFKPATASFLLSAAQGIGGSSCTSSAFLTDPSNDRGEDVRKSFSCERTFGKATREELKAMCQDLSEELQKDLERKGAAGKTITLKIKTIDFEVKTRARSIADYTVSASSIFSTAWAIYCSYEKEIPDLQLRLMGVRISNLRFNSDDDEGEDGSKGMKQQTLSQLFSKSSNNGEDGRPPQLGKYHYCPCCGEEFDTLRDLEPHVDDCLLLLNSDIDTADENYEMSNDNVTVNHENGNGSASSPTPITPASSSNNTNQDRSQCSTPPGYIAATCPICNRNLRFKSQEDVDVKMNSHIDECLNLTAVRKIWHEEKQEASATRVIVPSSTSTSGPGPSADSSVSVAKTKRQLDPEEEESSATNPNPAKRSMDSKTEFRSIPKSKSTPSSKSKSKSNNPFLFLPIDSYFKRSS